MQDKPEADTAAGQAETAPQAASSAAVETPPSEGGRWQRARAGFARRCRTCKKFAGELMREHEFWVRALAVKGGASAIVIAGVMALSYVIAAPFMLAAMGIAERSDSGLVVGAWGAVQATAIGAAMLAGGVIKNTINALALNGSLGEAMMTPAAGYLVVYGFEIILLFLCLAVLGPLTGRRYQRDYLQGMRFGLAELPG